MVSIYSTNLDRSSEWSRTSSLLRWRVWRLSVHLFCHQHFFYFCPYMPLEMQSLIERS